MSEVGVIIADDIAVAAQDIFYPEKLIVTKEPVAVEAMAPQALAEGVTIPDQVVQITGGPRSVWISMDATQYVDGVEIACALQFLFPNESEWQTAVSFTTRERGRKRDGTPADEWAAGFTTAFPLPDCQARAAIIVKGAEIKTAATIRW